MESDKFVRLPFAIEVFSRARGNTAFWNTLKSLNFLRQECCYCLTISNGDSNGNLAKNERILCSIAVHH